jgi:hypothetical protein
MSLLGILQPIVSRGQADEARDSAIMWTAFAVLLVALAVWRISAKLKAKKNDEERGPEQ